MAGSSRRRRGRDGRTDGRTPLAPLGGGKRWACEAGGGPADAAWQIHPSPPGFAAATPPWPAPAAVTAVRLAAARRPRAGRVKRSAVVQFLLGETCTRVCVLTETRGRDALRAVTQVSPLPAVFSSLCIALRWWSWERDRPSRVQPLKVFFAAF